MGFDLLICEPAPSEVDNRRFRAGGGSMGWLEAVLDTAGLVNDEQLPDDWPPNERDGEVIEWQGSGPGVPRVKLRSNDFWWVGPDECASIAQGLADPARLVTLVWATLAPTKEEAARRLTETVVPGTTEVEWMRGNIEFTTEFADFCRRAAQQGGFIVM